VLAFPVDKFQLFGSCDKVVISAGTNRCSMLFLWVLPKFASSRTEAFLSPKSIGELEEPPALELRAPFQGKGGILLDQSGI
jgi:hypothetical protein